MLQMIWTFSSYRRTGECESRDNAELTLSECQGGFCSVGGRDLRSSLVVYMKCPPQFLLHASFSVSCRASEERRVNLRTLVQPPDFCASTICFFKLLLQLSAESAAVITHIYCFCPLKVLALFIRWICHFFLISPLHSKRSRCSS